MNTTVLMFTLGFGLFVGMLALLEFGRRFGQRQLERDPGRVRSDVAAADGAVFALLGLLIAFTFSSAAARFQTRRELITTETNAIGTAWLRLDILPPDAQPAAREAMRQYVDARLSVYAAIPDVAAMNAAIARVSKAQAELWGIVMHAREGRESPWGILVVPALNEMFDIGTTRAHAIRWHPPLVVYALLVALALGCAILAGSSMAGASRRPTLHMVAFAFVVGVTVYVIVDFEIPRQGLIRIDADDQALISLRDSMR